MILAFAWYRALAQCWFDLLHFGETQVPVDLDVESPQIVCNFVHIHCSSSFDGLNLPLQQCKHLCFQGQMAFWNNN